MLGGSNTSNVSSTISLTVKKESVSETCSVSKPPNADVTPRLLLNYVAMKASRRITHISSTQRQARELISRLDLATRARLLSFNRTQSRDVIGLLTGHNTLRRHLYIMGLSDKHTCRKCGTEEETSVHILCECEDLASLRHTYLGSFFLDPEDIWKLNIGAIWKFAKGTGHP